MSGIMSGGYLCHECLSGFLFGGIMFRYRLITAIGHIAHERIITIHIMGLFGPPSINLEVINDKRNVMHE